MLFIKWLLMASLLLFVELSMMPMFVSASIPTTAKKLNDSAALRCPVPCSGVTRWERDGEKLSECGPGAEAGLRFICEVNEGQSVLHVPQVNYSTRGSYSVYCNGSEMGHCRQLLQLIPPEFTVELDAGDHLKLELHNCKHAFILFTRPGNSSTVELCSVEGRVLQCLSEYQERVLIVGNVFKLLDMKPSDSGNYSVQEKDHTLVSSSHVTVKDVRLGRKSEYWQGFLHGASSFGTLVLGALLAWFAPRVLKWIRKVVQRLRKRYRSDRKCDENRDNENATVPLKDHQHGTVVSIKEVAAS